MSDYLQENANRLTVSERIASRFDAIPPFIESVLERLRPYFSQEELFNIKLSFEESLINAIKHGNKSDPNLFVDVYITITSDRLCISVKDQGPGFDFRSLPDPTESENLTRTSGRGVFLIRKLMDGVEFFDCGRGIKMIKLIKKEEAEGENFRRENQ